MAGDAIHNLRSALDVAYFQMHLMGTGRTAPPNRGFPIPPSEQHWKAATFPEIGRWSQDAVELIKAAKAYKGQPLWVLSELDNKNKHQVLTTVACGVRATIAYIPPALRSSCFPTHPRIRSSA